MNTNYPVYTLKNECHDCYKCVRECSVKAIMIENGHASVISDKCIACGHCVKICPQKAKMVRNDVYKAKSLIQSSRKVYVSLAPSWAGAFDCSGKKIVAALKKLGFKGVSETALGAQEVTAQTAKILSESEKGLFISSACPASVDFIRFYMPDFVPYITPIASPALTHAKMLKQKYGEEIAVIFIGPCVAKKNESDIHPELISASLTFKEICSWFEEENIDLNEIKTDSNDKFVPEQAHEGGLYPLEGGMNETIKKLGISQKVQLINVSSIASIKEALNNLDPDKIRTNIFIEALACEGGCTNGPCINTDKPGLTVISDVLSKTKYREEIPSEPTVVLDEQYLPKPVKSTSYSLKQILDTMKSIGKYTPQDELDCGGCGYDTCRNLAEALLSGEAEPSMCVSYMRRLAMQKANAILRFMPSAIVIADSDLKIIESNDAFAKMFANDIYEFFISKPEGFKGAALERLIPCIEIFKKTLKSGKAIHKERYPMKDRLYDISVFTIEPKQIVGAVITDVTKTEMKREQIAKKAQEVISKNISIVQNIACLLGEHMVETELLLSSIAEGYESEEIIEPEEKEKKDN